jgi:hypothetical protein
MQDIHREVEIIYSVFKSIESSISSFKSQADCLNEKRLLLDVFIFDTLKRLYSTHFKKHWDANSIPYISDKAIIIVERRCHANLEFILHNVSYFAPGYAIHIFCSDANLPFIELVCGSQLNNIHIHPIFKNIGTPEEGKTEYNNLLKTKAFWNTFTEEHILTIETDCYLLQHIPDSIYEYDYVASQWSWRNESEPGGGGLSYRKCSIMKAICELDIDYDIPMQDTFASDGVKLLKGKYSHNFFTESSFMDNPIGVHQWWTHYANTPKYIMQYLNIKLKK